MKKTRYSKIQRRTLAEAFRVVKDRLERTGPDKFICNALSFAYMRDLIGNWAVNEAKHIIRVRMDYCLTLEQWLIKVPRIPAADRTQSAMYQYRMAWLDHLIQEFSS